MYSAVTYTASGSQSAFAITFPYLDQAHVEVSVNGVPKAITFPSAGIAQLASPPALGATVVVRRNSQRAARLVDFANGASLTEESLDRDSNQLMYLVQEAFDQATTQSYFSTDAGGARVTNVASPLLDTDAATKGWVSAYVSSLAVASPGTDLLPLHNVWTGINEFNSGFYIGGTSLQYYGDAEYLQTNHGLSVEFESNNNARSLFGVRSQVARTGGSAPIVTALWGRAIAKTSGEPFGLAAQACQFPTIQAVLVGGQLGVLQSNGNDGYSARIGLDVYFFTREQGSTGAGQMPTYGFAAAGTQSNYYNANSTAIRVTSQDRTEGGATYTGWNRGLRFSDKALDIAKVPPFTNSRGFGPGEYVTFGGKVWLCREAVSPGAANPVQSDTWAEQRGATTEMKAVAFDLGGTSQAQADRMVAGIRLRGQMPIVFDSENNTAMFYDPVTGLFQFKYQGQRCLDIDVGSSASSRGDLWLKGEQRILGTRSSVSAHRNFSGFTLPAGSTTQVVFGGEERDDRNEYDPATGRFTPNTPGDYVVCYSLQTAGGTSAGGSLHAVLQLNGFVAKTGQAATGAGGITTALCTATVRLNGTTDFLSFAGLYNGTGTAVITGEPAATFVTISKVS